MTTQNSAMGDELLARIVELMSEYSIHPQERHVDGCSYEDDETTCDCDYAFEFKQFPRWKDEVAQLIKSRDQQIALAAQEYQTHIRYIRTLSNGKEVWGIRIAYEGKQIYGDIANSEQEAKAKLDAELSALKQAQNKEK